jgi:hypothetical protein
VTEISVKKFPCCMSRPTNKAMGQVYQCWWICRQINVFFQVGISHVLRFVSICDLFTDSILIPSQILIPLPFFLFNFHILEQAEI